MSSSCLWFIRRRMSTNADEKGKALTDPLLSVNQTSGFTIEGTPQPLKDEIRGTWNKLKISMIFMFAITIVAVGALIYGCICVARAANSNIYLTSDLNKDIASFQSGGYTSFMETNLTVSGTSGSFSMERITDPYASIVEKNSGTTVYNSSIFSTTSIPLVMVIPPLLNCTFNTSAPTTMGGPNSTITYMVNYCVNGACSSSSPVSYGTFSVSLPYYQIEASTSLQQSAKDCAIKGGYYDKGSSKCLQLFVLTQVCIKVSNNSRGYHLDTSLGGSGCVYPFTSIGIYEQRNYTENTALLLNTTIDFFVRSADDPYISLQDLTGGCLSLEDVVEQERTKGLYVIILACVVFVVTLSLGFVLFFIKRKVKRDFRSATSVPNFYSRPPLFSYLALSIACFGIAIGAGFPLLAHWSELSLWTYVPFTGMMLIIYAGPMGMVFLLIFWQMLIKSPVWEPRMRSVLGGVVGAIVMVMCAFAVAILMKPWRFVYSTDPSAPDMFQVFFGIVIILTFFPIATLMLVISAHLLFKQTLPDGDQTKSMLSNVIARRASSTNSAFAVFGLFILFVVFLATAFLPPIWNLQTVGVYNIFHSPYSLIPGNHSNYAVIKLYLDVVVFYGAVAIIVVVGMLASVSRAVRRALSRWIRVRFGALFTVDTSVGEACFLLIVIGLAVWWFCWWYWGYGRIAEMTSKLERLARVMGHMTNLFSALLLFPITRNSIWVEIVGIPFERAVKYHRWAGVVTFAALTGHMLVWWIKWARDNTLRNIISVQNSEHTDNWSIPMVELTWLGGAVMVILSQNYFRRRRFELFYYTHHFFIVFYVTGLIHAWSMWYFTGGGMILWFVDRLIRFYKSSKTFPVADVQVHNNGDTTQLTLHPSGFSFRAGQYAFINIPSITPLEWHPFTISSAPGDTSLTFHIKDMGKNTWTARLARIYGGNGLSFATTTLPVVNIDGPYGNPPNFSSHENIILVAGGIGITPMISILKDIYQLRKQNDPKVRFVKNVYLLWVVRDLAVLNMFRDVFDEISNDSTSKDVFHLLLRVTQRSFSTKTVVDDPTPINPLPVMGRPNIHQEFADVAAKCGKHVLAMVCGPPPMVKEVENASYNFGFELHMETFEL